LVKLLDVPLQPFYLQLMSNLAEDFCTPIKLLGGVVLATLAIAFYGTQTFVD